MASNACSARNPELFLRCPSVRVVGAGRGVPEAFIRGRKARAGVNDDDGAVLRVEKVIRVLRYVTFEWGELGGRGWRCRLSYALR